MYYIFWIYQAHRTWHIIENMYCPFVTAFSRRYAINDTKLEAIGTAY